MMNLSIKTIIGFGLILRLFVALWNGFFGPSPGAELDALGFHEIASNVARTGILDEFTIGYIPYTNFLGILYGLTISHLFIGSALSCFAWLVSSYVLYKALIALGVTKSHTRFALLLYSIIPSSVMLTAVTLREPFQLLFANVAMYSIIKITFSKKSNYYLLLIASIFCLGVLHGTLLAFGIILFSGALILQKIRGDNIRLSVGVILSSFVVVLILLMGLSLFGSVAYSLDDGLDNSIQAYQRALLDVDARTHYKSEVSIDSLKDLMIFIPVGFFQYLFEPFPWKVSTASDALLLFENALRFLLILKAIKCFRVQQVRQRRLLILVFISYVLIELIWSLGTINWGTSVRHHIPAWGFLLLVSYASAGLTDFNTKSVSRVSA
jgi:hypothetical protein